MSKLPTTPPTTVEGFRENLKKYLCCVNGGIYVKTESDAPDFLDVESISSFADIYDITKTGFRHNGESPEIIPLVSPSDFWEFYQKTGGIEGFFDDEDNFEIHQSTRDKGFSPTWVTLDNKVFRHFFWKVFGSFSGYTYDTPGTEAV